MATRERGGWNYWNWDDSDSSQNNNRNSRNNTPSQREQERQQEQERRERQARLEQELREQEARRIREEQKRREIEAREAEFQRQREEELAERMRRFKLEEERKKREFEERPRTLFEWLSSNAISNQEKEVLTNFLILDIKGKEKIFSFLELKKILEKIRYIIVLDSYSFIIPCLVDTKVIATGAGDPGDPSDDFLTWLIKHKSYVPLLGEIKKIDTFTTWFTKNTATGHNNCATVINKGRKRNLYNVWVATYEDPWREMKGTLRIVWINSYLDYEQAESTAFSLKGKLDQDCPILWVSPTLRIIEDEKYLFINVVKIDITSHLIERPDDYIRPLDIVKRKGGSSSGTSSGKGTSSFFHAAIYLGDGWVCHIYVDNPSGTQVASAAALGFLVGGSSGASSGLTTLGLSQKAKAQVRIDSWKKFLGSDCKELIRYHPVIPFKKDEKMIEHIAKAVVNDYGKGNYNVFTDNCEHFADMIVYGVKLSEQWEKIREKNENASNRLKFSIAHPIRYFWDGEEPPVYYAEVHLHEKINDSDKIIGSLDSENPRESEEKCERFIIELRDCLKKGIENIKNVFSNYLFIPGGLLSENELKAKKQKKVAEELWDLLIKDSSYWKRLTEVMKRISILLERSEEGESLLEISEIERIVKNLIALINSKLFNEYEKIKQWKKEGDKWKKEDSKEELTREEILKKWKEKRLETRIELYQPLELFRS